MIPRRKLLVIVAMVCAALACRQTESEHAAAKPAAAAATRDAQRAETERAVIYQTAANDCGAAAITMTLNTYGAHIDLDGVKVAMKAQHIDLGASGLSALDLVTFARARGLGATGIDVRHPEALGRIAQPGDILHLDFDHFVVFDHQDGANTVILDPSAGRVALDPAALARRFTGVFLIFGATPEALERRKQKLGVTPPDRP